MGAVGSGHQGRGVPYNHNIDCKQYSNKTCPTGCREVLFLWISSSNNSTDECFTLYTVDSNSKHGPMQLKGWVFAGKSFSPSLNVMLMM